MKSEKPLTVLLADDKAFVRRNLCALLKADGNFNVVAEAKNGQEAVEMARAAWPDIILMDISMPILNGLEATRRIMAANPAAKVVILSGYDDKEYVERARAVGAAGFLAKQMVSENLATTIRDIAHGRRWFQSVPGGTAPPGTEKLWGAEGLKGSAGPGPGDFESTVRVKIV
jgi:two-component system nitrate/nitrite response regulator NarL